jgi:hypothetical protein
MDRLLKETQELRKQLHSKKSTIKSLESVVARKETAAVTSENSFERKF